MALRLVLKNAAATASGSRTFFTGPLRLVIRTPDEFTDDIHQISPTSAKAQSTPTNNNVSEVPAADKWYRWKDEKSSWCLRADMPGLDKDNVKVRLEENELVISGELGDQETDDDAKTYLKKFALKPNLHNLDGIKAEMMNGVLKVTVPKVQEEEKRVKNINVE